jgi:hypothetical protein
MNGKKRAEDALQALESILVDCVGASSDDICWLRGPIDQTRQMVEDALNEKLDDNPALVIMIWSNGIVVVTGKKLLLEIQHVRDVLEEAAKVLGVASFDVAHKVREMSDEIALRRWNQ